MEEIVKFTFDSDEELHLSWWLEELQDNGYIVKVEREPTSFKLSESINIPYIKQIKTKSKTATSNLILAHEYTADFKVYWTEKAVNIFFNILYSGNIDKNVPLFAHANNNEFANGYYTYIEVKPIFDQNNMTRLFRINQKWVYDKYKKYVNEVVPVKLFANTFTPKRYLLSNKVKQERKIKFEVRTLEQFLSRFDGKQQQLFI